MSVLPPDVHAELAQLLDALQSSDNSVRAQAEEHLTNHWTATKPEILLMGLVEQIQGSNDATVRNYPMLVALEYANLFRACRRVLSLLSSSDGLPPNLAS